MIGERLACIRVDFFDLEFQWFNNGLRVLNFEWNPGRDSFWGFVLRLIESTEFLAFVLVLGKLNRILSQLNRIGPFCRDGSLLEFSNALDKVLLFD